MCLTRLPPLLPLPTTHYLLFTTYYYYSTTTTHTYHYRQVPDEDKHATAMVAMCAAFVT